MENLNITGFESLIMALILILAIWDIVWKLMAMWKAANRKQKGWFIWLGILNTAGILPIIYLVIYKDESEH
jgi:hypothetical protein